MQPRYHSSLAVLIIISTGFVNCQGSDCLVNQVFNAVSQISAEVETLRQEVKTLCQEVKVIKNLVKVYVAPVSNLSERVTVLENLTAQVTLTVKNLTQTEESNQVIAAHLYGSGSGWQTISGVITYWSPIFLLGGITYSNGALTVPSDGIYYIYVQLHMDDISNSISQASIRINHSYKLHIYSHHYDGEPKSKHFALLQQLTKDDQIDIYGHGKQYFVNAYYSDFGLFKIG